MNRNILITVIPYIVIIDLLFIPYFPMLVMPYSLPLVLFSLLLLIDKVEKDLSVKIFLFIFITVLLSTLLSVFINTPPQYIVDNVKRALQFLTTFAYFYYFKVVFKNTKLNFRLVFFIFSLYILFLLLLFVYDPITYVNFKNFIYPLTSKDMGDFLFYLRFDYMFSDPNTAGYFITLALFFALVKLKYNLIQKTIIIIVIILTTISVKSVGVSIGVLIFIIFYVFLIAKNIVNKANIRKFLLSGVLLLTIIFLLISFNIEKEEITLAYQGYLERMELAESNTDSRWQIYSNVINKFYPSILGKGYTLLDEGRFIKPHNDHLRIIYSYGVITYILVLLLFFKKMFSRDITIIIPAFIAFSINSLIDEQKLLALFLIILSYIYFEQKTELNKEGVKPVFDSY